MSGGFDAFVGNHPFMGGTTISGRLSNQYLDYLTTSYEGAGNRTDLVACFFRRVFSLKRKARREKDEATGKLFSGKE